MRDVPSSVIFSSSCFILMLSGTCCIYFLILSLSVPGLLALPELLWLSYPKFFFEFRFQGLYIFWQFFSYFNWSVLFNKQAAFFLFILDCNVGSVGLIVNFIIVMMMMMMMSIPCRLRMFGLVYTPWGGLQQVTTGPRSLFSFFLKEQYFP